MKTSVFLQSIKLITLFLCVSTLCLKNNLFSCDRLVLPPHEVLEVKNFITNNQTLRLFAMQHERGDKSVEILNQWQPGSIPCIHFKTNIQHFQENIEQIPPQTLFVLRFCNIHSTNSPVTKELPIIFSDELAINYFLQTYPPGTTLRRPDYILLDATCTIPQANQLLKYCITGIIMRNEGPIYHLNASPPRAEWPNPIKHVTGFIVKPGNRGPRKLTNPALFQIFPDTPRSSGEPHELISSRPPYTKKRPRSICGSPPPRLCLDLPRPTQGGPAALSGHGYHPADGYGSCASAAPAVSAAADGYDYTAPAAAAAAVKSDSSTTCLPADIFTNPKCGLCQDKGDRENTLHVNPKLGCLECTKCFLKAKRTALPAS